MLEAGLQLRLAADPTLSALIGTRIYPLVWPSDTPDFPLVTYQRISTVTNNDLLGPVSLTTVRMQYDAWSRTYAEVRAIAAAVSASLEGFTGILTDTDSTRVSNITLDSCTDLYDSPTNTFRVTSDYLIQYLR